MDFRKKGRDPLRHLLRFALLLAVLLGISGCNRGPSEAGRYFNEKSPQEYTELKPDGTFVVKQAKISFGGKYSVEGDLLTLKVQNGEVVKGKISGNSITDNEGLHWIRP